MTKKLSNFDKMTNKELELALVHLGLDPKDEKDEAARLLGVNPRTFRRWIDGSQEIPGPAEQAINAWVKLNELGLNWRPDGISLNQTDGQLIAAHRNHAIELANILERVTNRGGPASPWIVDMEKRRATLGPLRLSFYHLKNGGFSPSFYSRSDCDPNLERDKHLIEDAIACIAKAYADKSE